MHYMLLPFSKSTRYRADAIIVQFNDPVKKINRICKMTLQGTVPGGRGKGRKKEMDRLHNEIDRFEWSSSKG